MLSTADLFPDTVLLHLPLRRLIQAFVSDSLLNYVTCV